MAVNKEEKVPAWPPPWFQSLFFLALWEALLRIQNPGLMSDDSGEMIAAASRLGVAHPPGYPLFCLAGRLFSFIPVGTVAFRFNLLSGLFTALALWLLLSTCRSFRPDPDQGKEGRRRWEGVFLAWVTVAFCFSDRSVLAQSLTAKGCVYTLTLFFASFLVWLRLRRGVPGPRAFFLALFAWSVGMANHWQTQALWTPFLLLWARREKTAWTLKRAAVGLSVILLGLSLYLYLPLRSALHPDLCWGDPSNWRGFYWVVSRRPFAVLEPVLRNAEVYGRFAGRYLSATAFDWAPLFFALALAGFYRMWKKDRELFYAFAALYLPVVAGIIAVPRLETLFLVNVYLVSTAGLWALGGFSGMRWLAVEFRRKSKTLHTVFLLLLALDAGGWLWHSGKVENKSRYTLAEDFGTNALKGLPRNSLFLADGDHYVMPILYEKYVRHKRPDLVFEPSVFLYHDWGWRQLVRQSADFAPALRFSAFRDRLRVLEGAKNPHPFFYSLGREDLAPVLDRTPGVWVPEGLASEWAGQPPDLKRLALRLEAVTSGERLRGLRDWAARPELDFSSREIYRYYGRQFYEAAHLFSRNRLDWLALEYFERGLRFHPEAFAYNDMAVILGGMDFPEVARRLCVLGIQVDPRYLPAYANLANCYMAEGDREEAYNCSLKACELSGNRPEWLERLKKLVEKPEGGRNQAGTHRPPGDYRALALRLNRAGLPFLGSLASSVALGMKTQFAR